MSRLLIGSQEESGTDMEKIAYGLGKNIEFFLSDSMNIPQVENIDEVMSAKSRFENIARR